MGKKTRISICDINGTSNQCVGKETAPTNNETNERTIPVIIGLDISTSCTGVCVLNAQTGDLIKLFPINFSNKKIDFWDKITHVKSVFSTTIEKTWDIKAVAVEENAKRFTPGFSSADTILTLAKFNGILCYILFELYNIKPTFVNVRSARAKLGIKIDVKDKSTNTKQKVLNHVFKTNPNFPWIYKNIKGKKSLVKINQDLADAYVIGAAVRKIYPQLTK